MSVYIDTHVAVWLAQGDLSKLSPAAKAAIASADLLLSPMVLLELQYLRELGRLTLTADEIRLKLEHELDARLCSLDFASVVTVAIHEAWTRDPFDRMIVANAKTNGLSVLVSADQNIRTHYPRAVW